MYSNGCGVFYHIEAGVSKKRPLLDKERREMDDNQNLNPVSSDSPDNTETSSAEQSGISSPVQETPQSAAEAPVTDQNAVEAPSPEQSTVEAASPVQQAPQSVPYQQAPTWQGTMPYQQNPQYQQNMQYQQNPQFQGNPQYQQNGQYQQNMQYQQNPQYQQYPPYQPNAPYEQGGQYGYQQPQKSGGNGLAIAAMILGIASLVLFCTCLNIPLAIISVILAIVHLVRRSYTGKGFAIAGIIMSGISVLISIIFWVVVVTGIASSGVMDVYSQIYEEIEDGGYEDFAERYYYDFDSADDSYVISDENSGIIGLDYKN